MGFLHARGPRFRRRGCSRYRIHASRYAPTQEVATKDNTATFSSKVNLVMVPVVVRDKSGHAIGTLRKEDFILLDRGKPQIISRFQIESEADRVKPVLIASDDAIDAPKTEGARRRPRDGRL